MLPSVTSVQFSSVQSLSRVRLFATPWIAACQASLSITNSRSSLRFTSIESVMPSLDGNKFACSAGDLGSIPRFGRSPGGGHGNPLQYSCLEKPMDRGAWRATVHGVQRIGQDWAIEHAHTQLCLLSETLNCTSGLLILMETYKIHNHLKISNFTGF